jgi:hypothetical protein
MRIFEIIPSETTPFRQKTRIQADLFQADSDYVRFYVNRLGQEKDCIAIFPVLNIFGVIEVFDPTPNEEK